MKQLFKKNYNFILIPIMVIMFMCIIDSTFKLVYLKYNTKLFVISLSTWLIYMYLLARVKNFWYSIPFIPIFIFVFKLHLKILSLFIELPNFITSVINNGYVIDMYNEYFQNAILFFSLILAVIFFYLIVIKRKPFPFIILGSVLLSVYHWLGTANLMTKANVFLALSLFLMAFSNFDKMIISINKSTTNIERKYRAKWYGTISMFIILVTLISNILPVLANPIEIDSIQKRFSNRFSGGSKKGNAISIGGFSFSVTGFQQNPSRLGGPVRLRDTPALRVRSNSNITGLHLRGNVRDYYNGYMWQRQDIYEDGRYFEMNRYKTSPKDISVEILNLFPTTTVFNPLNTYEVDSSEFELIFTPYDSGEIISNKSIKAAYELRCFIPTYTEDELMRAGRKPINTSGLENYLQISPTIPERVIELTNSIANYNNRYEMAKAIKDYLEESFPYSLDTSKLPGGRDFVDYFLFDEKKGSCTYYATAMVNMCRIMGIPARYIEGYTVSRTPDSTGYINVSNKEAHAWVEVYFEDLGWVTMDPTPGRSASQEQGGTDTPSNEENPTPNEPNNQETPNQNTPGGGMGEKETPTNQANFILIGALIAAFLIVIIIFVWIKTKKRLRLNERVDLSLRKIVVYGGYGGIKITSGITIHEYFNALTRDLDVDVSTISDIVDSYLYGDRKISKQEWRQIRRIELKLKKKMQNEYGKMDLILKTIVDFYIIGSIKRAINKLVKTFKFKVIFKEQ